MKIPAEVFTRDGARRARFEASGWLAAAGVSQIVELAQNGWRANSCAGSLEQYAFGKSEEVADLLAYVMYLRHGGLAGERAFVVDADAAVGWLARHRPEILAELGCVQPDGAEGGRRKRKTRPREAA